MSQTNLPTVVLVHGALTDASVWSEVARSLQREGYPVTAPAMPLRGLASDSAYLSSFLQSVEGEIVLVAHSYAGTVVSDAARGNASVKALVYVAAFQPEAGESTGALNVLYPGSKLGPETTAVIEYPGGSDLYLKPADFAAVYAADVPPATVAVMAATQRPIAVSALDETFEAQAAWHTIPSWTLIATEDDSLPTEAQRFMAARAHSHIAEVASSHAIPVAHPDAVIDVVREAARSINATAATATTAAANLGA